MRKQVYTGIAMVVLLGCLAVSARAQCSGLRSRVTIPFEFNVAKTTLPAGEYAISCQPPGANLLLIRSLDGKTGVAGIAMIPVAGEAQHRGYLVFHRYGSQYFFAQAWVAGMENGLALPRSRAERGIARELAGIKPKKEEIALKLRH